MAAITAADIKFRGSTTAGAAGNANAFGGADTSLGKYITNADLPDATLDSLFDDATGAENAASTVEYQCVFIYNANASNALQNAVVWVSGDPAGGANVDIAVDSTAASAVGAAPAQALQIANKTTAPAGPLTFSKPTTFATGLSLGSIPAGSVKAVWIRRTLTNSAALNNDGITLSVQGDTAAA
jgi:hypothetical protein